MLIGCFFPPQSLLVQPSPQFCSQDPDLLILPFTLYDTQAGQIHYHAFFMALILPSMPQTLQIESLHIFSQSPSIVTFLKQQLYQLMVRFQCRTLLLRLLVSSLPLYYPTTGFWTSPISPADTLQWVYDMGFQKKRQATIWRMPCYSMDSLGYHAQMEGNWFSQAYWNQMTRTLRLIGAENVEEHCQLIPDLYPEIKKYGKMPLQITRHVFPHVRICLDEMGIQPEAIATLTNYLFHQGVENYDIGNIPDHLRDLANTLASNGGQQIATLSEYQREISGSG